MNHKKIKSLAKARSNSVHVVDGDISYAIRAWKKILKDNNSVTECHQRTHFVKPSDKNRIQKETAKYIQQKVSENDQ